MMSGTKNAQREQPTRTLQTREVETRSKEVSDSDVLGGIHSPSTRTYWSARFVPVAEPKLIRTLRNFQTGNSAHERRDNGKVLRSGKVGTPLERVEEDKW